jgi:soluble lytic murein transglycosylase
METDVWVENIPYNETRGYVRRVSWHAVVFAWLAEKKPQNVESWLSQIRRPASDAALQSN